jgi:hypothetical protein
MLHNPARENNANSLYLRDFADNTEGAGMPDIGAFQK